MRRKDKDHSRTERIGSWGCCCCGQEYRVWAVDGEVRMWPRNSREGYRAEPIGEHCLCRSRISRGTVLSALFGANPPNDLSGDRKTLVGGTVFRASSRLRLRGKQARTRERPWPQPQQLTTTTRNEARDPARQESCSGSAWADSSTASSSTKFSSGTTC
jgi:hypothetical protein